MSAYCVFYHSIFTIGLFIVFVTLSTPFCNAQQLIVQPSSILKPAGSSFYATCKTLNSSTKVKSYKWYNPKNEEIPDTNGRGSLSAEATSDGIELYVKNVKPKLSGGYTCRATLENMEVISADYKIQIYKAINFTDAPEQQWGPEGSNHLVKCVAKSKPESSIKWHYTKRKDAGEDKYKKVADGLMINNVDRDDEGVYLCNAKMASDQISEYKERKIQFHVQYAPECHSTESNVYTYIGENITLNCRATGVPNAIFTWYRQGHQIISNISENLEITTTNESSELQIYMENATMFGEYSCNATNFLGHCSYGVNVSEVAKPGVPYDVKITADSKGTIKLTVKAPKILANNDGSKGMSSGITKIKVQYKKTNESWDTAKTEHFDYDKNPYIIRSLEQETQYVVRVAAGSAVGYGNYSKEQVYKLAYGDASGASQLILSSIYLFITAIVIHNF